MSAIDTYNTKKELIVNNTKYHYFSLKSLEEQGFHAVRQLPFSLKILLENLLRHEDEITVNQTDIDAVAKWDGKQQAREIAYRPARVLMQDFTGVPAVVDLGAMRDAIKKMDGDPQKINPLTPVDLVIDHSIQVDTYGSKDAIVINTQKEMARNAERYVFLRWGQKAFRNFRVVPPETGICHQVNLEFLAKTIWQEEKKGTTVLYPDTLVGTDSHTTMINGLGVLGWGVGGIEAEAAMLGQPISMLIPDVVGVRLQGKLQEGVTATDLVLAITHELRQLGVVGKFVEYFGNGLKHLTVADRATLANMAPEYGATCGFFPIDQETLNFLRLTGRDEHLISIVEAYAKEQGLWFDPQHPEPNFTQVIDFDLSQVEPCVAGPKRPQDKVKLTELKQKTTELSAAISKTEKKSATICHAKQDLPLQHHDIVIAAITSCTNTSNPSVLMAAGLVAKKAVELGLKCKPWVKSSLAPGSQVVTQYLEVSGLQHYLDQLGFAVVGYGCTTCIGNSGPLPEEVSQSIADLDIVASAVLSGNRNFEGRIHPQIKANWLASPPLVVIFALAGTMAIDLHQEPIGKSHEGKAIYFKDLWPTQAEIAAEVAKVSRKMFAVQYADVFSGNEAWQKLPNLTGDTYQWQTQSSYIQHPPYFLDMKSSPEIIQPIQKARILALLGDSITTDHISPAGSIKADSPAGKYLQSLDIAPKDFNSYGARRGNHEIMMRGTFANIRIKNEMLNGFEGGYTKHFPSNQQMSIYDAAMQYKSENVPVIIIAGKEYGTGSSRDWAAKGPKLQGVKAVIAESFERIHRSNLIGMGILPLEFTNGENRKSLQLIGDEVIDIHIDADIKPRSMIPAVIHYRDGKEKTVQLLSRIDTQNEMEYFKHGGILHYVLRNLAKQ